MLRVISNDPKFDLKWLPFGLKCMVVDDLMHTHQKRKQKDGYKMFLPISTDVYKMFFMDSVLHINSAISHSIFELLLVCTISEQILQIHDNIKQYSTDYRLHQIGKSLTSVWQEKSHFPEIKCSTFARFDLNKNWGMHLNVW